MGTFLGRFTLNSKNPLQTYTSWLKLCSNPYDRLLPQISLF